MIPLNFIISGFVSNTGGYPIYNEILATSMHIELHVCTEFVWSMTFTVAPSQAASNILYISTVAFTDLILIQQLIFFSKTLIIQSLLFPWSLIHAILKVSSSLANVHPQTIHGVAK